MRSLFRTGEDISREVLLELMLLIDLFIVVITTLLEPTLFFDSVHGGQEMVNLAPHSVLPAIQGAISLLLNGVITECKYLTMQANSCSNLVPLETEMGSFPLLLV